MSCELCYFEHNDKRVGPCYYCAENRKDGYLVDSEESAKRFEEKLKSGYFDDKKRTKNYTDAVVKGGPKHEDRLYLDNTLSVIIGQLALNSSYLQHVLKLLCEDHKLSSDEMDEMCKKHAKVIIENIVDGIKEAEKAKEKENDNV